MKKKIHLDTDLGSDTDDLCALAYLLGREDVELTGITTCTDPGGRRAGMVSFALGLAGRVGVPVVAGAEGSVGGLRWPIRIPDDERYWPEPIPARPGTPDEVVDVLLASVEQGATIVAIGPWTNLALLEAARPGALRAAEIVVMGGWLRRPRAGLPQLGPEDDYNVQQDTAAAKTVLERGAPLIADIAVTVEVQIREADLPLLEAGGPLCRLIARQARAHAKDSRSAELAGTQDGLPSDFLNLQYDVVAAAAAVDWPGLTVDEIEIESAVDDGLLRIERKAGGHLARLVASVDADALRSDWLETVRAL